MVNAKSSLKPSKDTCNVLRPLNKFMVFTSGMPKKYTIKDVIVKGKDSANDVRTYYNTKGEVVTMRGPTKASISGSLDITDVLPKVRHLVNQRWTTDVCEQDPDGYMEFLDRLSDLLKESNPRNEKRALYKTKNVEKLAKLREDTEAGKNKTASKLVGIVWAIRKLCPQLTAVPCSADPAQDICVPPYTRYVELAELAKERVNDACPGYKYHPNPKPSHDQSKPQTGKAKLPQKRGKENIKPSNSAKKTNPGANKSRAKRRKQTAATHSPVVPYFSPLRKRRSEHDWATSTPVRPRGPVHAGAVSTADAVDAGECSSDVIPLPPLPPSPPQWLHMLSQGAGNVECSPLKLFPGCHDEGLDTTDEQEYLQHSKDVRDCNDINDSDDSDDGLGSSFSSSSSDTCHSAMHCDSSVDTSASFGLHGLTLNTAHSHVQLHEQQQKNQKGRCQKDLSVDDNVSRLNLKSVWLGWSSTWELFAEHDICADVVAECDRAQRMAPTSSTNPATQTSTFRHFSGSSHDPMF